MRRVTLAFFLTTLIAIPLAAQRRPVPAPVSIPDLSGVWTLNRGLSQFPKEVGFGMDVVSSSPGDNTALENSGRSGNPRSLTTRPQTEDVARNTRQLVQEAKEPTQRLIVEQTSDAVTMTDARGMSRTFRTDGRDELQPLDAGPLATASRWESGRLVVRYKVEPGREIRYTYTHKADPRQLVVQTEFVERGGHDTITRVYEPAKPGDPVTPPPAALPMLPSQRVSETPGLAPPTSRDTPALPAPAGAAPQSFDQRRDAELIGLSSLGLVVEGIGPEAEHCGIKQGAIETAASKALSDSGLKVVRNTDNDTYLYINVNTTAMSTGFCFTRYDVYLYSHTTATMSYGARPVLVQVSLLNKGGITGSGASSHGEAVVRAIRLYAEQISARVRDVNR
jgi:hypothetical protein